MADERGAEPEEAPEALPDRVDAYLTRKAQQKLDARALVLERPDGNWLLAVPDQPTFALGDSFGRAKQALWALIAAKGTRK